MAVSMPSVVSVRTITTSATRVTGGVTTYAVTSPRRGSVRKGSNPEHPGRPDFESDCECPWIFDDENDRIYCPICDCSLDYLDIGDLDHVHCDCDPCRCPIDFDWMAGVFMALLAAAYAFYKTRKKCLSLFIAFK